MIHRTLRDILRDSAAIRDRVDKGTTNLGGIYADYAPEDERPEYIILTDVTTTHHYHLQNEANTRTSIIQVDCYSDRPDRAASLFELVRNLLSGRIDLDNGIQAIWISGGLGSLPEPPEDKSGKWIDRYSKDFSVIHVTDVPTHA